MFRLTRARRKWPVSLRSGIFLSGSSATPPAHRERTLLRYIYISSSHTSAVSSCPLPSRCPAPALVHCSWRHSQHGGQGDSVNISNQIFILKAGKRLWRYLYEGHNGQLVRADALGDVFCLKCSGIPLYSLFLHVYIDASLPASHAQLWFLSPVAYVCQRHVVWSCFML